MAYATMIAAVLASLLAAFTTQIGALVTAHPIITLIASSIGTIAAAFATAPKDKK